MSGPSPLCAHDCDARLPNPRVPWEPGGQPCSCGGARSAAALAAADALIDALEREGAGGMISESMIDLAAQYVRARTAP